MDIYTEIPLSDINLRKAVYEAHEGKCFYTGRFVLLDNAHVDHIYPKSLGGANCLANYVLTEKVINIKKSDAIESTLIERMQYINVVAFAPIALSLYQKYSKKVLLDLEWLTLDDFLESKNIDADSLEKSKMRSFLKARVEHRTARPLHRRGKHIVYRAQQVENLYLNHPQKFHAN